MKLGIIGCMVLSREVSYCVYQSEHSCQCSWIEQGLHDTPSVLKARLQGEIDKIEAFHMAQPPEKKLDAIVLAYGLCSNGILDLTSKVLPLVVPRCDDCIALLLGSMDTYLEIFNAHKGIYWFNKGWVENAFIPSQKNYDQMYADYLELYDKENADYLIDCQTSWVNNYESFFFIDSPIYNDDGEERFIEENAAHFGLKFEKTKGKMDFISDLISGNWVADRFLVTKPGQTIVADYTGKKVAAKD